MGDGFVAAGNALTGPGVIEAMAQAFRDSEHEPLADRLLGAVEAGQGAGGEPRAARSASLAVYEREEFPNIDLRVDAHHEPIAQLRRLYSLYTPFIPIHDVRANQPDELTIEIHDAPYGRADIQEIWNAI